MDIKKNWLYILIIVVILVGGIYSGIRFLKPANAGSNDQTANASGQNPSGQNGRFAGGRGNVKPLTGTISSISGMTIVMTASDGSTKNIATTGETRISEMENGSRTTLALTDLTVGETINVMAQDTSADPITPRIIIVGTFSPPSGGSQGGGWNAGGSSSDNSASPDTSVN